MYTRLVNDAENTLAGKMSITLCMFADANAVGTLSVDLSAGSFALMKLVGIAARSGREKNVTMFFTGGLKNNISVVATIAVTFFPEPAGRPAVTGILFQQDISAIMWKLISFGRLGNR